MYQTLSGKPGFTQEAFDELLKNKCDPANNEKKDPCALNMDGVAIRKYVEWVGDESYGYVDFGTGDVADEESLVAREALAPMLVALN